MARVDEFLGLLARQVLDGQLQHAQRHPLPVNGRLSLEALESRDYPVFLGLLSVTSVLGLLGQILSDFCYVLIDPRIRFDR